MRCAAKLKALMPIIGLRNPKIGRLDNTWDYCGPFDWVISFHSGQLWLAAQLTGDPAFVIQAQARRRALREILGNPAELDLVARRRLGERVDTFREADVVRGPRAVPRLKLCLLTADRVGVGRQLLPISFPYRTRAIRDRRAGARSARRPGM